MASPVMKRKTSPVSGNEPPAKLARGEQAQPTAPPVQLPPVLREAPELPEELWRLIPGRLIPDRPLLYRGDDAQPRFAVAAATRALCRVGQASSTLQRVVAQLRMDEEHAAYRDQASRQEYELGERSDEVRCAARERYGIDPARPDAPPGLLRLGAFSPEQWPQVTGQIAANAAALRELRLNLRSACAAQAPQLADVLPACTALQRLSLSSNASLPLVFGPAGLPPALRHLRVQALQLAPQWQAYLAQTTLPAELESLVLAIPGLDTLMLNALGTGAQGSRQLRMLAVSDGLRTPANCDALAKLVASMGLLRLDLGRGGGLCAAGADTLVAAVCAHPTLNRIGLHGLDDPDAAQALFTALRRKPQLQELVYTGPLNKEGFEALGKLVEGTSGLLALSLDGCALGPLQMEALAGMVAANRLRELYLANQEFDDAAAGAFATAVGKSTALLGLGFRNCAINPEPARCRVAWPAANRCCRWNCSSAATRCATVNRWRAISYWRQPEAVRWCISICRASAARVGRKRRKG
jgi:hypothetical protein